MSPLRLSGKVDPGSELAGLFQHGVEGVDIEFGVRRAGLELADGVENLMEDELHVAQGRGVLGHRGSPSGGIGRGRPKAAAALNQTFV
ncbi:hypothetical protein MASR2M50_30170 [Thauera sp.]